MEEIMASMQWAGPGTSLKARAPVDSMSDDRVVNNVMRHEYRVLDQADKINMKEVKDLGLELHELFDSLGSSRELSLAKTRIEACLSG